MAKPAKRKQIRKDKGLRDFEPDFLQAVKVLNIEQAIACTERDPDCIEQIDHRLNNAMHICIGSASSRAIRMMRYLAQSTAIDLLHQNADGMNPLQLAIAINDIQAIDLLEKPTNDQLSRHARGNDKSVVEPVP